MTPINNNQMSEIKKKIEEILTVRPIHEVMTWTVGEGEKVVNELSALISRERAEAEKVTGETSDGYHTFNELYNFRKLYNACLFNEWAKRGLFNVHKSKKHSDGELCFGGGWFIVTATLPTGQLSNHYELKDWDLFQCEKRETADKWDGHTPQDVLKRLTEYLSNPDTKEGK